jgi:hypothetical protein
MGIAAVKPGRITGISESAIPVMPESCARQGTQATAGAIRSRVALGRHGIPGQSQHCGVGVVFVLDDLETKLAKLRSDFFGTTLRLRFHDYRVGPPSHDLNAHSAAEFARFWKPGGFFFAHSKSIADR